MAGFFVDFVDCMIPIYWRIRWLIRRLELNDTNLKDAA